MLLCSVINSGAPCSYIKTLDLMDTTIDEPNCFLDAVAHNKGRVRNETDLKI